MVAIVPTGSPESLYRSRMAGGYTGSSTSFGPGRSEKSTRWSESISSIYKVRRVKLWSRFGTKRNRGVGIRLCPFDNTIRIWRCRSRKSSAINTNRHVSQHFARSNSIPALENASLLPCVACR
jgi:hypothetical protein